MGTSYEEKTEAEAGTGPPTMKQFADAYGTPVQRFSTYCGSPAAPMRIVWRHGGEGTFAEGQSEDWKGRNTSRSPTAYENRLGPSHRASLQFFVLHHSRAVSRKFRVADFLSRGTQSASRDHG